MNIEVSPEVIANYEKAVRESSADFPVKFQECSLEEGSNEGHYVFAFGMAYRFHIEDKKQMEEIYKAIVARGPLPVEPVKKARKQSVKQRRGY